MPDHITSDGVRLSVELDGASAAPAVVLVHGLAGSVSLNWRGPGVIDRLTAAGLRTIAFDLRGHGRSDAPGDEASYGDARMVDDVIEIVDAFATRDAVIVGYSLGAAITLLALEAGLDVRAAVVGAAPAAVLGWSEDSSATRDAAVAVLRGLTDPDDAMKAWLDFLDATGQDRDALASVLAQHRPVVEHWDRIMVPCAFVAGEADAMAAPLAALSERLPGSRTVTVSGDHFTALATAEFSGVIVDVAASAGSKGVT